MNNKPTTDEKSLEATERPQRGFDIDLQNELDRGEFAGGSLTVEGEIDGTSEWTDGEPICLHVSVWVSGSETFIEELAVPKTDEPLNESKFGRILEAHGYSRSQASHLVGEVVDCSYDREWSIVDPDLSGARFKSDETTATADASDLEPETESNVPSISIQQRTVDKQPSQSDDEWIHRKLWTRIREWLRYQPRWRHFDLPTNWAMVRFDRDELGGVIDSSQIHKLPIGVYREEPNPKSVKDWYETNVESLLEHRLESQDENKESTNRDYQRRPTGRTHYFSSREQIEQIYNRARQGDKEAQQKADLFEGVLKLYTGPLMVARSGEIDDTTDMVDSFLSVKMPKK